VIARPLLAWYDRDKRPLPWRDQPDPYRIWLSEVMLQQTRIEAVRGYYDRFLERFPTVEALAAAPLDAVLHAWAGLGYYSRARNLHRAAQMVAFERGGRFPDTADELAELPGVGRYTAGAIASIAFGRRAPVVDGNVARVLSRLAGLAGDVRSPVVSRRLWALAAEWIDAERPGDFNQALMELGETICVPRSPDCARCPVRARCAAHRQGRVAELPTPRRPPERPEVAALWRQALEQPGFAEDRRARIEWWWRRTPYWDDTVGLLPVLRLMSLPELPLHAAVRLAARPSARPLRVLEGGH